MEIEHALDLGSRKDREDRQKHQKINEIVSVLEKKRKLSKSN